MANEQKKQTGTTDPSNRPNQPRPNPSGGSSQNPGRRSDEWSDKDRNRSKNPSDPNREGGMGDDSDLDLDTDESENPA